MSKWISVRDKLPELKGNYDRYLIVIEGDNMFPEEGEEKTYRYVDIGYCLHSMDANGNEIYYWANDNDSDPIDRVIYWMTLPDTPKK